jgi:hypothetical protein
MPTQHGTTVPAGRYFAESPTATDRVSVRSGRSTATTKSAANALARGEKMPKVERKKNR